MKTLLQDIFHKFGYEVKKYPASYDAGVEADFRSFSDNIRKYSAQSWERLYALYKSLHYITDNNIPGAIVECGVYKGATPMMAGYVLSGLKQNDRKIYLYDTFDGMTSATKKDVLIGSEKTASDLLGNRNWQSWCSNSLEEVQKNVRNTGYPYEKFIFVKGKCEETIPATVPDQIALLRLDTDWYESTRHNLIHLFPKLSLHGILLLDDYGHWKGAREAVDEYFAKQGVRIYLQRIDYAGYIGVKTST